MSEMAARIDANVRDDWAMRDRIAAIDAQLAPVREAMSKVYYCPDCGSTPYATHASGCQFAAALALLKVE